MSRNTSPYSAAIFVAGDLVHGTMIFTMRRRRTIIGSFHFHQIKISHIKCNDFHKKLSLVLFSSEVFTVKPHNRFSWCISGSRGMKVKQIRLSELTGRRKCYFDVNLHKKTCEDRHSTVNLLTIPNYSKNLEHGIHLDAGCSNERQRCRIRPV